MIIRKSWSLSWVVGAVLVAASLFISVNFLLYYFASHISSFASSPITFPAMSPSQCDLYSCFNRTKCNINYDNSDLKLGIAVPKVSSSISKEYSRMLSVMSGLSGAHRHGTEACLAVPAIDTLDANRVDHGRLKDLNLTGNDIVFNLIPSPSGTPDLPVGGAMVASTAHLTYTIRTRFDISIPFVTSKRTVASSGARKFLATITATNEKPAVAHKWRYQSLEMCSSERTNHITHRCTHHNREISLVEAMTNSEFCVLPTNSWYSQSDLAASLASGCIPVLLTDTYVLPFEEVIDWKEAAVLLLGRSVEQSLGILNGISEQRRSLLRSKGRDIHEKYFSDLESVVETVVQIIVARLSPVHDFHPMSSHSLISGAMRNLHLYRGQVRASEKFTAVILTHDRVDNVFSMIKTLMEVPELDKVIVVWNNEVKKSPPEAAWPAVDKPLKIIHTWANRLTNRFLPFSDIATDAVLSLDDDITHLSPNQISAAFRVWQENPASLTGFISLQCHYEDSSLTMISLGAAFYHKYWADRFLHHMPESVMAFIEENKACEDVAFNLFVCNLTSTSSIFMHGPESESALKLRSTENDEKLPMCLESLVSLYGCVDVTSLRNPLSASIK